jgi:hypothetical protein
MIRENKSNKSEILFRFAWYHPIITVGTPETITFGAPVSVTLSPILAAKKPLIKTVRLPFMTTPPI